MNFVKWSKVALIPIILIGILGCSKGGYREQLPAHEQLAKAMDLYNRGKYMKAQIEFQRMIYSFPGQAFTDTVQYYLGLSFSGMKYYPEAIGEFKKFMQAFPSSQFADDAQYQIAICHYKQSPKFSLDQTETYAAIDEFSMLLSKFPASEFNGDARDKLDELNEKLAKKLFRAGMLYFKMNDYEPAQMYFMNVRDNYPNTDWAVHSVYYTGEVQRKLGNNAEALSTFQNLVVAFPDHKLAEKARKQIAKLSAKSVGS